MTPAGWQSKTLGEICQIELGKTPARANSSYWDATRQTDNVWLSIADLLNAEDNLAVDSKEYLSDKGAAICKIVPTGTLLVSFKLTLGRLAFAGRALYTNEAIAALRIFNEQELCKEYLFYFLHFFDWRKAAEHDVKIKGMTLNKAKLKELAVYFPSLSEQQRIVGILDKAFDGIGRAKANAEQNRLNARAVFDSHLEAVFSKHNGWVEKRLADVCQLISGQHIDSKDYNLTQKGIGYITGPSDFGNLSPIVSKWTEYPKVKAKNGDILITVKGSGVGKINLLNQDNIAISRQLMAIRVTNADTKFMYSLLSSKVSYFHSLATGAAIPGISREQVLGLRFALPTLSEQRTIVAKLDSLREQTQRLEAIARRKQAALDELKKALLHQAFSGQL